MSINLKSIRLIKDKWYGTIWFNSKGDGVMNEDLKVIKKKYGENMMRLCRDLFPTILEQEGLLSQTMLEHFEPSHELYNDIIANDLSVKFKNYIYRWNN